MQDTDALVRDTLLELEDRRCAAICAADGLALQETLAEDYVHVHATGNVDDRQGFITGVLSNPRVVERGSITIRMYGDVAILIGEQINRRGDTAMIGIL